MTCARLHSKPIKKSESDRPKWQNTKINTFTCYAPKRTINCDSLKLMMIDLNEILMNTKEIKYKNNEFFS